MTQLDLTLPYKSSVTKRSEENSQEENTTGSTWGTHSNSTPQALAVRHTKALHVRKGGWRSQQQLLQEGKAGSLRNSCAQSPGQRKVGGSRGGRWHRGRRRQQPCSTRPSSHTAKFALGLPPPALCPRPARLFANTRPEAGGDSKLCTAVTSEKRGLETPGCLGWGQELSLFSPLTRISI